MTKRIATVLKRLPITPGVYQFLDAKKRIIYVGKAANLKNRIQSYFRDHAVLSGAKQQMVGSVADIKIISTESEIEALLLEANLIKKFQPHYNVTLRDDKSYLYVKISTDEEWPRVFATRTIDKAGTYFGPFTSAHAVRETLRVLRKFLPYRCNQKIKESQNQRITKSHGNLQRTNLQRTGLRSITETRSPKVRSPKVRACFWYHLGRCPGTCIGAITNKEYQKTIRRIRLFFEGRMDDLRRTIKKELGPERVALMDNVLAHTRVLSVGEQYANDTRDLARVLGVSSLHRIEGYDISNIMGRDAVGSMVVFVDGEPAKSEYKKFKIKTVAGANDVAMLEEVLMRRMRHSINPTQPPLVKGRRTSRSPFKKGEKLREWSLPDLIIVDGGKAQLNAAVRVLHNTTTPGVCLQHPVLDAISVIAVAKGGHGGVLKQKEEIYFPGEARPLKLPNASPALHLVLRIRDEAHRFAIGYHKILRGKRLLRL